MKPPSSSSPCSSAGISVFSSLEALNSWKTSPKDVKQNVLGSSSLAEGWLMPPVSGVGRLVVIWLQGCFLCLFPDLFS